MLTLLELKKHIEENSLVGSMTLANQFDMPESLVEDMLERLIKKGLVLKRRPTANCGSGCQQSCPVAETYVYEWVIRRVA
jgi:predicted transcriptional regulator